MKTKRPSLKNSRAENDLIRRVQSLERDVMLLHAIVAEKLDAAICDYCDDGLEKFFFPKLVPAVQMWFSTGGLLTYGTAWCRQCLNDKWPTKSADFEAENYDQSKNEVAAWIAYKSKALIEGSALSQMDDVLIEVKKIRMEN